MYAFSSKSGSEPFRALGDLTWDDPIAKMTAGSKRMVILHATHRG